jgi:hypothetical protein
MVAASAMERFLLCVSSLFAIDNSEDQGNNVEAEGAATRARHARNRLESTSVEDHYAIPCANRIHDRHAATETELRYAQEQNVRAIVTKNMFSKVNTPATIESLYHIKAAMSHWLNEQRELESSWDAVSSASSISGAEDTHKDD